MNGFVTMIHNNSKIIVKLIQAKKTGNQDFIKIVKTSDMLIVGILVQCYRQEALSTVIPQPLEMPVVRLTADIYNEKRHNFTAQ